MLKRISVHLSFFLALFFFSPAVYSAPGPQARPAVKAGDHSVDAMVAELSDEQVRRILIRELKKQARENGSMPPALRGSRRH